MIRPVQMSDATAIARIYHHYVTTTTVSFETEPPSADEIAARIQKIVAQHSWLVYENAGALLGYAYTSAFRERRAYQATVESTVYLDQTAIGHGIGRGGGCRRERECAPDRTIEGRYCASDKARHCRHVLHRLPVSCPSACQRSCPLDAMVA